MTETQERFLKLIAERVPPDRVVELHLFPSLRQGPIESGVAVIAAEPTEVGGGRSEVGAGGTRPDPPGEAISDEPAACDPTDDAAAGSALGSSGESIPDAAFEAGGAGSDALGEEGSHLPPPPPDLPRPTSHRLTIYTARYRLTIKGPDRGRWEATVSAEADAPLVTLEAVVRGVRHRAGDAADTERLSGEEFRAALAAPAWMTAG